jgi:signal transduction histidine kinase/DNA-binding response OmpR family regulator
MHSSAAPAASTRVLILAPTGRDAEITADLLARSKFECLICEDVDEVCSEMESGAGLVLLTAEALTPQKMKQMAQSIAAQPPWSDLPLMIMVAGPEMSRAARSFDGLGPRAHVTLVDRPIHVKTLLSAARAAIRSRMRQYEIRDLLLELEARVSERDQLLNSERDHAQRLAGLTEASLSIASALSLDDVLRMITREARKVLDASVAVTSMSVDQPGGGQTIKSVTSTTEGTPTESALAAATARLLEDYAGSLEKPMRFGLSRDDESSPGAMFRPGLEGSLVAPVFERDGRTVGVIALAGKTSGTFSDEDVRALTQLAQMASAAVQNARLYREAQDANKAKDDFLATLAHELRTPMTGILGWVQMLKMEDAERQDISTAIQMIESSTRVQARLVEDLLDVSRIIAGKLRIESAAVELGPVIETVVETFRARAGEYGLTLASSIEPKPLSVYGDETRLHQVIWNLMSNAIKFTPRGGTVNLTLRHEGSDAVIRVSDTGQGIAPEFLPHVFERFRQADNTTTRSQAGLGLGLAIVRHLVEIHSGKVLVESEGPGLGTTFTVRLPVLAVRLDEEQLWKLHEEDVPKLDGIRVLVVDDDGEAAELVLVVLRELGAEAQAATSVAAAVKALRSFEADVVVSDIAMPGEDGYALMRRLKELQPELKQEVRTVALTGYGRPEDRRRILSSGFQQYIQKPVEPVALARAIASLIRS